MDEKKVRRHAVMALVAVGIGFFAPNYAQYQISPLGPELMETMGITASQFSSLFTSPMIPAILLSFLAGVLVDRLNPKLVVAASFVLSTAGAALDVVSTTYGQLFFGLLLTGVSATFLNSSGSKLLGMWYPPEKVSSRLGGAFAMTTTAQTIALATTALFPSRTAAFTAAFAIFVIDLVCWFVLFHNREPIPQDADAPGASRSEAEKPADTLAFGESLRRVMSNRYVWVVAIALLLIICANVVMGSFVPTILGQRGIDSTAAGTYSSAFTAGSLISCFLGPALGARFGTRRTLGVMLPLAAVFIAFGWNAPAGAPLFCALLLAGVFLGGTLPMLMSVPITIEGIGPELAGTAGGLASTVEMVGAVVLPSYVLLPVTGSYLPATFVLSGVVVAGAAVLTRFLPRDRAANDDPARA